MYFKYEQPWLVGACNVDLYIEYGPLTLCDENHGINLVHDDCVFGKLVNKGMFDLRGEMLGPNPFVLNDRFLIRVIVWDN